MIHIFSQIKVAGSSLVVSETVFYFKAVSKPFEENIISKTKTRDLPFDGLEAVEL